MEKPQRIRNYPYHYYGVIVQFDKVRDEVKLTCYHGVTGLPLFHKRVWSSYFVEPDKIEAGKEFQWYRPRDESGKNAIDEIVTVEEEVFDIEADREEVKRFLEELPEDFRRNLEEESQKFVDDFIKQQQEEKKMGKYLNPEPKDGQTADQAKYFFCRANGSGIGKSTFDSTILAEDPNNIPVVIVDNGPFKAAMICDCQDEINYVRDNPDSRQKLYFSVRREALTPYL